MNAPARPLLRWHGGKWRLAPWIIDHMPAHSSYIEPFGGGASVLLRKPRSRLEIYNDLDGEVVNLFRVLRTDRDALIEAVALTPFARDEFDRAYAEAHCPLERARRLLIRSHMGFGSNGANRTTGFRAAGLRAGTLPVHQWAAMPAVVQDVAERMRGVVIENRPAIDVMIANDAPSAVHYVDPPYMPSVRGPGTDYAHEMTEAEHMQLLELLRGLSGTVLLSGYASDMYDAALPGWKRVQRATIGDRAKPHLEVLWINRTSGGLFG